MLNPIQFDCVTPAMCLYNLIPSSLTLLINIDMSWLTRTDIDIYDGYVMIHHDVS